MDQTRSNITTHGYTVMMVPGDDYLPGFAYTIGLFETYQQPEIIVVGLDIETLKVIIDTACIQIKDGKIFEINTPYPNIIKGHEIEFLNVNKVFYSEYLGQAMNYYESDFPCIQLIWSDSNGKYPWEADFDSNLKLLQPLLDRDTDFLFYENKNLGVYTTKDVLKGSSILYVYHDEDGDWQFHSSENPDESQSALVSLYSIVKNDPSLNRLYYLGYGQFASRKSPDSDWEF